MRAAALATAAACALLAGPAVADPNLSAPSAAPVPTRVEEDVAGLVDTVAYLEARGTAQEKRLAHLERVVTDQAKRLGCLGRVVGLRWAWLGTPRRRVLVQARGRRPAVWVQVLAPRCVRRAP